VNIYGKRAIVRRKQDVLLGLGTYEYVPFELSRTQNNMSARLNAEFPDTARVI